MTNTEFKKLEEIKLIPVPESVNSMKGYQAVPHTDVIDVIKENLDKRGLGIVSETYKVNKGGNIIYGNILTDMKTDTDLGGAIHFVNSYDKSKKLQISSGAIVLVCTNGMTRFSTVASTTRKHVGTISSELYSMAYEAVYGLETEYLELMEAKNIFAHLPLYKRAQSELAGRLFMEEKLLTVTQMSVLQQEMYKTEGNFVGNTAWNFYNWTTQALKLSHPADYITDHAKFHKFMIEEFVS